MTTEQINSLIIPCGISAKLGGNYGDASPIVKLLAKTSKYLITNQYSVTAGILSDIPENVLVLEGFMMDRFFANQIVLRPNVRHRIAVICDKGAKQEQIISTQNAINAARHFYGLDIISEIFFSDSPLKTEELLHVEDPYALLEPCARIIQEHQATAFAICICVDEDQEDLARSKSPIQEYSPLEQIEAKISSLISKIFLRPCGVAPLLKNHLSETNSKLPAQKRLGYSLLPSVFKALQHSPLLIPRGEAFKLFRNYYTDPARLNLVPELEDITISMLKNLVMPFDACNNTPTVEAYQNHIKLICVRNNTTSFNEPASLYAIPHQVVSNYLEAAGSLLDS